MFTKVQGFIAVAGEETRVQCGLTRAEAEDNLLDYLRECHGADWIQKWHSSECRRETLLRCEGCGRLILEDGYDPGGPNCDCELANFVEDDDDDLDFDDDDD